MKHHDGRKRVNKLDGGKGRAKKQWHKALREAGKTELDLYWNERYPTVLYYIGLVNGIPTVFKLGQPVQFEIDSACWMSTFWDTELLLHEGHQFEFIGAI
jgi:hypothetical protein